MKTKKPKTPELLELISRGLAKTGVDLWFMESWGPARMFVFLRGLLPKLFEHLSDDYPWVFDINDDDDDDLVEREAPLLLLYPENSKLDVATLDHPTGASCLLSKGRSGAGPKASGIWLSESILYDLIIKALYLLLSNTSTSSLHPGRRV